MTDQNEGRRYRAEPLLYREPDYGAGAGHLHGHRPRGPVCPHNAGPSDAGDFTIDENGQLTFRNVPNYERPADSGRDNVYNLSVRASDGRNYGYLEVTVTVEDVNEAPTITTTSKTAFSYRENGTATIYTFKATDPERSAIAWSVSGTDEDDFTISETGVLSFASSPNYESPTDSGRDNVYEVTVVAKDDAFNSGTLDVVVTVTDQNEGPEISGQQSLSFTENQTTERVLATYTGRDPEDTSAVITRWSLTGADAGDFTISENGQLTFRNVPDHERPADSGRGQRVQPLRAGLRRAGTMATSEVTVTVQDVNEPPAVTGTDTFTYREERYGHHLHLQGHRSRTERYHLVAVGSRRRLLRHQRDGRPVLRQLSELREPRRLGQ